ncbi:hypothetical protein [Megasphaera cerevisiae]|uniref:hyaluronate lyase N-terminal domain-containing protein n=1 Tax=Megasphaera cerevisiae TaxID=39029 RepID=UPI00065AF28B|nr:hypothetical protein [Megasphaera cerevisiae]SKA01555.1 hypothetical protein SAMN05660900_02122 [Megasphaera cerevisiae DSM 20462]
MGKTLTDVTLQLKNGTKANWASINPTLAKGELGLESDTAHFKFGDGVNPWTDLAYAGTIVKASASNGQLLIDGIETIIYTLPQAAISLLGGVKSQAAGSGKVVVGSDGTMSVAEVPKADILTTARTLTFSGDVAGNNNFDGSGNVTFALALVSSGVTAGTYTKLTVDAKGRVTAGANITASDVPSLTLSKITDSGTAAAKNVGVAAGNVPLLDSNGKLNSSVIPAMAINEIYTAASQTAMLALSADVGDVCARTDGAGSFMLKALPATTLANWVQLTAPTDVVTSVNGKTGVVVLTTDNVAEGTNLYYTDARATANFNTNFANKTVGGLSDGANVIMSGDSLVIDCGTVS